MTRYRLNLGDCLEALRGMPENSVDSIVTDPPYGLSKEPDMAEVLRHWLAGDDYEHRSSGFMGKTWDSFVPGPAVWRECLRVLKPGGHLLAFFGSRTHDIGTLAIRLAGFEIRDMGAWLYGSGFPKSMDVSKAIDKAAGDERPVVGFDPVAAKRTTAIGTNSFGDYKGQTGDITSAASAASAAWQGWGTALKPAHEPITFARKPLIGTVAANVLAHGTGALNIDGCRVGGEPSSSAAYRAAGKAPSSCKPGEYGTTIQNRITPEQWCKEKPGEQLGRWPANLIHDGSDEVVALFPANAGAAAPVNGTEASKASVGNITGQRERVEGAFHADKGSAARFFYCAKASRKDRNEGLPSSDKPAVGTGATMREREDAEWSERNSNHHPTVKPTDLMAYLCRLVTPPGGVVLDPYMGSGSTGKAAIREGFRFIGCELSPEYLAIARARIEHELGNQETQQDLFSEAKP